MSSTTEESAQQSSRSVNDSKQTHILYDDADTARRNILRIPTPIANKGRIAINDTPVAAITMPNFVREPASDVDPGFKPLKRSDTNPYRKGIAALGRSLGLATSAVNRDLAEEGRSPAQVGIYGFSTTTGMNFNILHLKSADSTNQEMLQPIGLAKSRTMIPFLQMRTNASPNCPTRSTSLSARLETTLSGWTLTELQCESVVPGRRLHQTLLAGVPLCLLEMAQTLMRMLQNLPHSVSGAHLPDSSRSMSDSEDDCELSFIDQYDYTRENTTHAGNHHTSSNVSIEAGRGEDAYIEEDTNGWAMPVSPLAQFRTSSFGFRTVEDLGDVVDMRPRPLISRRDRIVQPGNIQSFHRDMRLSGTSDVPTSEKTYGETNQLLQITPKIDSARSDKFTDGRSNPIARTWNDESPDDSPGSRYRNDEMDNYPEFDDDEHMRSPSFGRFNSIAKVRTGSMALSPSIVHIPDDANPHNRFSVPSRFRTSSEPTGGGSEWIDDDDDVLDELEDSPGCTEDEDLDEIGNRYSQSNYSNHHRQSAATSNPQSDLRQCLALDSFPNLNNPNSEASPQRPRKNGEEGRVGGQGMLDLPHTPVYHSASENGSSIRRSHRPPLIIDFSAKPAGDVKRALAIMKRKATVDKLGAGKFMSPGAHSTREYGDMKELERIRVERPEALDEATARFEYDRRADSSPPEAAKAVLQKFVQPSSMQNKLKKIRIPAQRQEYVPSSTFKKVAALGRQDADHGSFSSQRALLQPSPDTNLQFSASEGTFVTIRKKRENMTSSLNRSRDWDPHGVNPTDHALNHIRSLPSTGIAVNSHTKMRSTSSKSGQPLTAAIGGQIELREFKLKKPSTRKGLTDEELAEREPGWTNDPTQNSPHCDDAKLLSHGKICEEQMDISLKYQSLSALIPFGALIYGLGGFDGIIARKTEGRITSMDPGQKSYVLKVYFPLQLLLYTIIGIGIGIAVYMTNCNKDR